MNFIEQFAQNDITDILATFFVSMLPVFELRVGIPLGVSLGLGIWLSLIVSIIGNLLPVPFIILFVRRVFSWIKRKIPKLGGWVDRMEQRAFSKSDYVYKYTLAGLAIFVAIPLPGTGAWTGALLAALLNIRLKSAMPAIAAGVVIAGILVSIITFGVTAVF